MQPEQKEKTSLSTVTFHFARVARRAKEEYRFFFFSFEARQKCFCFVAARRAKEEQYIVFFFSFALELFLSLLFSHRLEVPKTISPRRRFYSTASLIDASLQLCIRTDPVLPLSSPRTSGRNTPRHSRPTARSALSLANTIGNG